MFRVTLHFIVNVKVKQSHYRPGQALRFQEFEAPRLQDSRHMKFVRSALCTGRLYPPGNTSGTPFLLEVESTAGP